MGPTHVLTGATEPIQVYAVNAVGNPLTGLTDLYVRVRRFSDGFYLDWNDMTFKSSGWTTLNKLLTELDATNAPGLYSVTGGLNTGSITNPATDDTYTVISLQTPGVTARLPSPAEIKMGRWVDQMNVMFGKLPDNNIMGSGVKTDKDDEIDAILTDTADMQPKVDTMYGKLPDNYIMGSGVTTDKDDEIDAILADTNEMQGKLPTNNIMGSSVKDDKDDEIDAILADTAAMDARLPADPTSETNATANTNTIVGEVNDVVNDVWDEDLSAHTSGGTMGFAQNRLDVDVSSRESEADAAARAATNQAEHDATQAALAGLSIPSAGDIADQVWDETLSEHQSVGSTGEALGKADAPTLSEIANGVWDELLGSHVVAGSAAVELKSKTEPGDQMDLVAGALDSNSLDVTAVGEIADGVWDESAGDHVGSGSMGQLQNHLDVDISSRSQPGDEMDLQANALDANAVATSGAQEIAGATWDESLASHAGVGSAGEAQARIDVAVSTRAAPGAQMALTLAANDKIVDDTWREQLSDHNGVAGSMAEALDDAKATADPDVVAAAVWNDVASTGGVGSMGELQRRLDANVSSRAQKWTL